MSTRLKETNCIKYVVQTLLDTKTWNLSGGRIDGEPIIHRILNHVPMDLDDLSAITQITCSKHRQHNFINAQHPRIPLKLK